MNVLKTFFYKTANKISFIYREIKIPCYENILKILFRRVEQWPHKYQEIAVLTVGMTVFVGSCRYTNTILTDKKKK